MEELNRSSDGTDGNHALAAGFKARSGGRSGGRGGSEWSPPPYAPKKRNFALKTDFSLAELEGGLVRVEELNRSSDGTDGNHALAAGFKARSGGRSGGRGGHNGTRQARR